MKKYSQVIEEIRELWETVNFISSRLHRIEQMLEQPLIFKLTSGGLTKVNIKLPPHLELTHQTLLSLGGRATAEQVSHVTHRARAMESSYLNMLVNMHLATKEHDHRRVVFQAITVNTNEDQGKRP